ncbi:hypothetical protein LLH23_22980 [bacterium]|nr:hypothetical protein [bacterium]
MKPTAACACALLLLCVAATAAPVCEIGPESIVLANQSLRREWTRHGDGWQTSRFVRGDGREVVAVSAAEEFVVKLWEGPTIAASECQAAPPQTARRRDAVTLTFPYSHPPSGLRVSVQYWLRGDGGPLRKSLTVTLPAGKIVDELEVEHLVTDAPATRGGYGQPLFLGDAWFLGLEYPAGYNDVREADGKRTLVLHHYPGRETGAGLVSKTAMVGVAPAGLTRELAFSDYLDSIRIQTRDFLQYNSWYDLRSQDLTIPNLLHIYEQFQTRLLQPYGLKMAAFVPDDGWQDRNSIWQPLRDRYPEGFRPLSDGLEARGSHLGLWMPLNGTNLNPDWGREQGLEVSDRGQYYCIAAPKYNAEIRRVTAERIRDGRLAYYKHDFNGLHCSAPGHGHLPTDRHGHEASLDAEIELLAWERQVNPGIFLNVTSSVWLSPWWLMHADSIWMCASDFGYEKTYPQLSPREWDMSYRDAHFYRVYRQQENLVPLSALMTHGIIHGKLCKLGGAEETLREFSDMAVLYYARGVQLKELYVTPDLMDEARWRVLGQATRWAVDNAPILRRTVMVGGDPRQGEAYGYVHWQGDRGLVALRNPAPALASLVVPFDQSVYYRGPLARPFAARVIYPYRAARPRAWFSGSRMQWQLPGCSVIVVELAPDPTVSRAPEPPLPTGTLVRQVSISPATDAPGVDLTFTVPGGEMPRCDLLLTVHGSGPTDFSSVKVNGQPATPRKANGPAWHMQAFDLKAFAGQTVTVAARLPRAEDKPFALTECPVEAWLIADCPTGGDGPAPTTGLFPVAQGYRRDSQRLLQRTISTGTAPAHVSDEDFAQLRGAKLRLEVFDANREPQYADKWITLNGQRLARVPGNTGELASWQECYVDLAAAQLPWLQRTNRLTLGTAGGDCYKFRGLGLALQRDDGKWVTTAADAHVYCSVGNWLYAEGAPFVGGVSPEITIGIP